EEAATDRLRRFAGLESGASFRPWQFRPAYGRAVPRASQVTAPVPAAALARPGAGVSADDAATVWAAFAALEPPQYALLDLHLRRGLSVAEVAGIAGLSAANAGAMVSRLQERVARRVGADLIVRHGRAACPELDRLLTELGPAATDHNGRAAIERHAADC